MPTWDFIKPSRWQSKVLELNSTRYQEILEILCSTTVPTDEILQQAIKLCTALHQYLVRRNKIQELFEKVNFF